MTYAVLVTRAARSHIANALAWYEREAPDQMPRFQAELARTMRSVGAHPLAFRTVDDDIRRAHLAVFPYKVWFLLYEEWRTVEVFAVLHDRQDDQRFRQA